MTAFAENRLIINSVSITESNWTSSNTILNKKSNSLV